MSLGEISVIVVAEGGNIDLETLHRDWGNFWYGRARPLGHLLGASKTYIVGDS